MPRPTDEIKNVNTVNALTLDIKKSVLYVGHAGRGMRLCGHKDNFYCFSCPTLSFAIPKEPVLIGSSWIVKGLNYRVIGREKFETLGLSIEVCVIVTNSRNDRSEQFYYSNRYGLMAFSFFDKDHKQTGFHVLKNRFGFPK